jgi:O-antigen chain-terminating methyltransferase
VQNWPCLFAAGDADMHAHMTTPQPGITLPRIKSAGVIFPDSVEDIEGLAAALPEIYQPIYGHPELSSRATRGCEDRLEAIISIYRTLEAKLNRPLRVLDLGCAQGFFSLSLAELGATVRGIDLESNTIPLCNALAAERPRLKIEFAQDLVERVIAYLEHDQYDLVLGLSVFHHLVRRHGIELTQKMLAILAEKTAVGIYEMALAAEPASWAAQQPQNPRDLMQAYAFVHEFARHPHHLSAAWRPMYVASNRYWFLNGQAEAFHSWKNGSHAYASVANHKTRRYFFGQGHMVKLLTLDDEKVRTLNLKEHAAEAAFLTHPSENFSAPRLYLYGQHQTEAWLVRECLSGELLCDIMAAERPYDAGRIIRETLDQLVTFEAAGLYHNDLRPANIIVTPDGGARVIDFGAITPERRNRSWPHDLFLSFLVYMRDVLEGRVAESNTARAAAFNPENFPDPYRHALWRLYGSAPETWSFAFLGDCLTGAGTVEASYATRESMVAVMTAMENACKIYQDAAVQLIAQNNIAFG